MKNNVLSIRGRNLNFMGKHLHLTILLAIALLFLFTRFYKISEIPSGVYWDEASIGYNAYSILQTGKDEWGNALPLHFKAFGEYKLPVYIYSVILPVKLFGLNELSVRLPAVIFALFNILLTYLIARKISKNEIVGLLSAFSLSITPYFFIFSRVGYEAVPGLTFFLLGVFFFLQTQQRSWNFIFSTASLVLSMYTYNGYRILSPLTLLIFSIWLIILWKAKLNRRIIPLILAGAIFILGSFPLYNFLRSENSISRFQAVGIENLDRKKVFVGLDISKNFLAHFNPVYLFVSGDSNLRSQLSGFGELYIYDAIFLVMGLIYFRKHPQINRILPVLLLLGFLPASVSREVPHALRSLAVAPFFSIFTALGVVYLSEKFGENKNKLLLVIVAGYVGLFFVYFNNFTKVYASQSASFWQEGYKLIFQKYSKEFAGFDHVLISDRYAQPYIFALFYMQYNPDKFRSGVVYNTDNRRVTSQVKSFDKFIFDDIDYNQLPSGKTLIFAHPTDRLNELWVKNILYHDDGSVAFYVYEYQK